MGLLVYNGPSFNKYRRMKMNKEDTAQWLGNRGHMVDASDIIKCKKIGKYLFVQTKEYQECVDLYDLSNNFGECQEEFRSDKFRWNKGLMRMCITGEEWC
jgi:hypothetical protein